MPVVSPQQSSSTEQQEGEAEIASGVEYEMSGGSAEAKLVMSEWVKTDDNGWTKVGCATSVRCVPAIYSCRENVYDRVCLPGCKACMISCLCVHVCVNVFVLFFR